MPFQKENKVNIGRTVLASDMEVINYTGKVDR